jgi:hypothetical protein
MTYFRKGCWNRLPLTTGALLGAILLLTTQSATAGFLNPKDQINEIRKKSQTKVLMQHFGNSPFKEQRGFKLFNAGRIDFKDAVKNVLRQSTHSRIKIKSTESTGFNLTNSKSYDYQFFINDVPVCGFKVRAHHMKDNSTFVLGGTPQWEQPNAPISSDWPSTAVSVDRFVEQLRDANYDGGIKLKTADRCYYMDHGEPIPVWKLRLHVGGLPFSGYADAHELYGYNKEFFHVDGTAKVHKSNIVDESALTDTPITGLVGDGTLTTDFLITDPNGVSRVNSPDHVFTNDPSTLEYDEIASFTYAQQHLKYFQGIGFTWYGPKPLQIKVHEKPNGDTNNALFMPAEGGSVEFPTIFVGDGDGQVLQNLGKDGDVVSHELSHHVIYKYLKETKGESLILHEGLADFFVFARTGDACLGESICPVGGAICWESACLRTAKNDLVYGSPIYSNSAPHQKGQLISGYLWDMVIDKSIPVTDLEKMVLRAIDFLVDDSGIEHFLLALFNADADLFASKYHQVLKDHGATRGLTEFMGQVGTPGSTPLPKDVAVDQGNGVLPEKKSSTKSESSKSILDEACGVISADMNSARKLGLLLFFLLPIAMAGLLPRREKVVVRRKK